jgi:hypothetical protein
MWIGFLIVTIECCNALIPEIPDATKGLDKQNSLTIGGIYPIFVSPKHCLVENGYLFNIILFFP